MHVASLWRRISQFCNRFSYCRNPSIWSFALAGLILHTSQASGQAILTKADNTTSLDQAASWNEGSVPDSSTIGVWNNTLATNFSASIGSGAVFGAIQILNPAQAVTISAGAGSLTLGNLSIANAIDLTQATQNLTIASSVVLATSQTWDVGAGETLTVSGSISGSGVNLTTDGAGSVVLSGANTYSGNTNVSAGTLTITNSLALQNSTLNFTGGNLSFGSLTTATLGGLSGSQNLALANATAKAVGLMVGDNNQDTTYSGNLSGAGSLHKFGTGTLTLTGNSSYADNTTVDGGTLVVSGAGAKITGFKTMTIGQTTASNLTISNGGNVTAGTSFSGNVLISNSTAATSAVLVDGANSVWNLGSNQMVVGQTGTGSLTISNGGTVASNGPLVNIGNSAGSNGTATITGANATWNVALTDLFATQFFIGNFGTGTMNITNGGNVTSFVGAVLGNKSGSNGTVLVDGTNSTWNAGYGTSPATMLHVGLNGNGTLTISNGGTVLSDTGSIGDSTPTGPTSSSVLVTGANSTWNLNIYNLFVGNSSTGTLTISNGGQVTNGGGGFIADFTGATGTVLVTGANSTWSMGVNTVDVGEYGNGTLTVSSGGNVTTGDGGIIGDNVDSIGTAIITGTNSTFNLGSGGLVVGNLGTGCLTISSGAVVNAGTMELAVFHGSSGTVNLQSGGVLQVGATNGLSAGVGTYAFNWADGTVQVKGSKLTTSINATLVSAATASILDTQGFNATWSGVLSGSGSLTKIGSGTLTLNGADTYTGSTTLSAGTLVLGDSFTLQNSTLIYTGGTMNLDGMSSVTLGGLSGNQNLAMFDTLASVTLTVGANNQDTTFSGVISGNGSLTKNGTGTLTLTGLNTYSGTTIINGGTLVMISNTAQGSTSINNGTLILTGDTSQIATNIFANGTLQFDQGGDSSYSGSIFGNGTLIKSGTNNLTLGGVSTFNGTTTLSAGTLTLGNSQALANSVLIYNTGGGTLNFGTLTSATMGGLRGNQDLALANANAMAVTLTLGGGNQFSGYSGNLSGPGSIIKTGTGTLTFSGVDTYAGNTTINAGTLVLSVNAASLTRNITNNGTLTFTLTTNSTFNGVIQGSGQVTIAPSSNFNLTLNGSNTYTGNTTNNGIGTLILGNSLALQNSTLNLLNGNISFGNLTSATIAGISGGEPINLTNAHLLPVALTIGNNGPNLNYQSTLFGSGSLTKVGTNVQFLSSPAQYTGITNIMGGILSLSGGGALVNSSDINLAGGSLGSPGITISSSQKLTGNGNISGNTTINGILQSGNSTSAGLLAFSNNLTLNGNASTLFQLGGATRGTQYSAINITGGLNLNGTLSLTLINNFLPNLGATFDLFQAGGSLSGAFTGITLPPANVNYGWDTSQLNTTGDISVTTINLSQWMADEGLTGANAQPTATPFGGRTANLLRYAMNLDATPTPALLPTTGLTNNGGTNYLTIIYRARKNMSDYQLVPQYSTDLSAWTNVDAGNITQLSDADSFTAQFQAAVALPGNGQVYLRVQADPITN